MFRQLSDEIEEDLELLAAFIKKSVKNDDISASDNKKSTVKTYKLIKATKIVFANAELSVLKQLVEPVLKLIDNYYYDNRIPSPDVGRIEYFWLNPKNR